MSVDQNAVEQVVQEQTEQITPHWWKLLVEGEYAAKRPHRGDVYEATILSMGDHDILVTVDGKRDGIVMEQDLAEVDESYLQDLKVGEKIPVQVIRIPFNRSAVPVSLKQGMEHQDWILAEASMESEETLEVEVVDTNSGGVLAPLGRLQGFIPNSHLTSIPRGARPEQRADLKEGLIGKSLTVKVIEVNSATPGLILSESWQPPNSGVSCSRSSTRGLSVRVSSATSSISVPLSTWEVLTGCFTSPRFPGITWIIRATF